MLMSVSERIEERSCPEPNTGCLLWLGYLDGGGCGQLRVRGVVTRASRAAWEDAHGPIPDGMCVCHKRQMKVFVAMIDRWPNFRKHIGYALLGGAIGAADMMGCDVEGFLVNLRKREPRPTPIEPGPRSAS